MANSMDRRADREEPQGNGFQGIHFHDPVAATKEERIRIMGERASRGECIWTGNSRSVEPKYIDPEGDDDE